MAVGIKRKSRNRKTRVVQEAESKVASIDFKMVTFTLAGKDYGIDIMKVKEIAKFINFTYVPNTPPFVRGVYNLRGEIISIIDLREMFNLPMVKDDASYSDENGLILRLDSNMIGVVVDKIDKVVGISSSTIQPPHPIFGDINIKYISGVVENEGRLYIILDVERILGEDESAKEEEAQRNKFDVGKLREVPKSKPQAESQSESKPAPKSKPKKSEDNDEVNRQFIRETLVAFEDFFVSDINQNWYNNRFNEWKKSRSESSIQLEHKADAGEFLRNFHSDYSSQLWERDLFDSLTKSLPDSVDSQLHIWNPGCGKGYETYSLAVLLKKKYPDTMIKIWASDKDLLAVSGAPNLIFEAEDIPDFYKDYMVEGPNGWSFNQEIKDAILFEYHDIINSHSMPPIQLMVARDLLSYLEPEVSAKILSQLDERMKPGGIVILGKNEEVPGEYGWKAVKTRDIVYYKKNTEK